MRTFSQTSRQIRELLSKEFPEIDLTDDYTVANRVDDLAFIIAWRSKNPPLRSEEKPKELVEEDIWKRSIE